MSLLFRKELFVIYLFSIRYTTDWANTDLFSVLELILHGGDIRAQAQDLRLDPGVLSLELGDFSLQCVEILALDTGGPATARVTLTRAYRTPVSRTTGFQPWRQDRHGPVWSTTRYTAEREIYDIISRFFQRVVFTRIQACTIRTPFRLNAKYDPNMWYVTNAMGKLLETATTRVPTSDGSSYEFYVFKYKHSGVSFFFSFLFFSFSFTIDKR